MSSLVFPGADAPGSTPSLASRASNQQKVFRLATRRVDDQFMFIRFVCSDIDERSLKSAGLFFAASKLRWSEAIPEYEMEALIELRDWFNIHLPSPFDYLPRHARYDRAICWFKSDAREHLAKAWELIELLERNDIFIWAIKSRRTGYVYYEDEAQVFARPYDDPRLVI